MNTFIALFVWGGCLLAVLALRYQWLPFKVSFGLLALAVLVSAICALVSLGFAVFSGQKVQSLVLAAIYSVLPLAVALLIGKGWGKPLIHDISTSPGQVTFVQVESARGSAANPIKPPSETQIIQQNQAYPGVQPLLLHNMTLQEAYQKSIKLAKLEGWDIVFEEPPARFEAVARTPLLRFADDVVVVLESEERGVVVNMRSVSRVGKGDFGANAQRIERFLNSLK